MNWKDAILAADRRIEGHIRKTPIATIEIDGVGPVEMKLEQVQHTGSFKARGAFNTLLGAEVPPAGLVAASGGNHGAAVAYAASHLGHRARIFVPEMAGETKIALIRRAGADLTIVPGAYSEAAVLAGAEAARTGAMQVHAYDAEPTLAGQGTCLLEWEKQGLAADTVLIAVGGGGLIGGAMAWSQGARRIVAVEPESCRTLGNALDAGEPVDVPVSGIAANALGAKRIGALCFELAGKHLGGHVTVSDEDIAAAQRYLWEDMRQLVEPAGACALAALLGGAYRPEPGERVAVLLCGGNISRDPLA